MANFLRTVRGSPLAIVCSGRALCLMGALACLCCVLLSRAIAPQIHQPRYLASTVVNLGSDEAFESIDLAVEATDPALAHRILAHQAQALWESENPVETVPDFIVSVKTLEPRIGVWTGLLNIMAVFGLLGALFVRPTAPEGEQTLVEAQTSPEQTTSSSASVRIDQSILPMLDLVIGQILECSSHRPRKFLILSPEMSPRQVSRAAFSLRLASHFADLGRKVHLVDLDFKEGWLTRFFLGGDRSCVGLTEWIRAIEAHPSEFLTSVPEYPSVNFAPVGLEVRPFEGTNERLVALFHLLDGDDSVFIWDAGISPHLMSLVEREEIDTVICFNEPGLSWTPDEQDVLNAIRRANLPVWGIAKSRPQAYPLY